MNLRDARACDLAGATACLWRPGHVCLRRRCQNFAGAV